MSHLSIISPGKQRGNSSMAIKKAGKKITKKTTKKKVTKRR